jgi:hypothetical protein
VAWILRLVKTGAEGDDPGTGLMEISRPDGLCDIADLGLILAEAKLLLASVQREIATAQTRVHESMQNPGGRHAAADRA